MSTGDIEADMQAAVAHHRAGRLIEAEAGYRHVLLKVPRQADALHMLGLIAVAQGRHTDAAQLIRRAVQYRPQNPEAYFNLAVPLDLSGDTAGAQAALLRATQQRPTYAEAHFLLGKSYHSQWKMDAAIASLKRAVELLPSNAEALILLAGAYRERGMIDQSIAALRATLSIDPDNANAYSGLGVAYSDQARLDEAVTAHRKSMELAPAVPAYHSNLCYCMHYHPGFDAKAIKDEHQRWNDRHAAPVSQFSQLHTNDRTPNTRLRIGYLSPDFRVHPVGRFMLSVFKNYDRGTFEIHCYSTAHVTDSLSEETRRNVDAWHDAAKLNDEDLARQIHNDGIEILVELSLHSAGNRLQMLARKPAPVQVTWLGYASTTGLTAIDYRLGDPYLDPAGTDDAYTEQTIRLPTYWCYPAPEDAPAVGSLPSIKQGLITFGSMNNFVKLNDGVLNLWIEILKRVDRSRLLLHSKPGSHWKTALDKFTLAGIAADRISFIGAQSMANYLRQFNNIDIALDTSPYSGGTTTCDALYMGVPVVTLSGRTAVGRMGAALLSHLHLEELIAQTDRQYVEIAAQLATNAPRLIELRSSLRQRMLDSPLMDARLFTAGIESALRRMWTRYLEGPL